MDDDAALPSQVVALFHELEDVLTGARERLDALLREAVPVQGIRRPLADPEVGGR